jgi:hypothetical protein
LTVLRNLAAHGRSDEIDTPRAVDFLQLVDAVLYAHGNETRRSGALGPARWLCHYPCQIDRASAPTRGSLTAKSSRSTTRGVRPAQSIPALSTFGAACLGPPDRHPWRGCVISDRHFEGDAIDLALHRLHRGRCRRRAAKCRWRMTSGRPSVHAGRLRQVGTTAARRRRATW